MRSCLTSFRISLEWLELLELCPWSRRKCSLMNTKSKITSLYLHHLDSTRRKSTTISLSMKTNTIELLLIESKVLAKRDRSLSFSKICPVYRISSIVLPIQTTIKREHWSWLRNMSHQFGRQIYRWQQILKILAWWLRHLAEELIFKFLIKRFKKWEEFISFKHFCLLNKQRKFRLKAELTDKILKDQSTL